MQPDFESLSNFITEILICSNCQKAITKSHFGTNCDHLLCLKCYEIQSKCKENLKDNVISCPLCKDSYIIECENLNKIIEIMNKIGDIMLEDKDKKIINISLSEKFNNNIDINKSNNITYLNSQGLEPTTQFSITNQDLIDNTFVKEAPFSPNKKLNPVNLVLETQIPIWQNINFSSLEELEKQKILEELIKNMKIHDIARVLTSNLNINQLNEIQVILSSNMPVEERVISETDTSELEKQTPSFNIDKKQLNTSQPKHSDTSTLLKICDPSRFVLTSTRFPTRLKKKLTEFCDLFGISIRNNIDSDCTHLLMNTDDRCEIDQNSYTFKYLFALAAKMNIISHLWILECLKQGILINEDPYQVKSNDIWKKSLSQNLIKSTTHYLFESTCIFVLSTFENFRVTKDELIKLLIVGKAAVKTSLEELETLSKKYSRLIAIYNDTSKIENQEHQLLKKFKIRTVNNETILECVLYSQLPA